MNKLEKNKDQGENPSKEHNLIEEQLAKQFPENKLKDYVVSDDENVIAGIRVSSEREPARYAGTYGFSTYGVVISNGENTVVVEPQKRDILEIRELAKDANNTYLLKVENRNTEIGSVYKIDFETQKVTLLEDENLGQVRFRNRVIGHIEGSENLQDITNNLGEDIVRSKLVSRFVDIRDPEIICKTVDDGNNLAAIAVGTYTAGCGPALGQLEFYVFKATPEGFVYANLGKETLRTGSGSPWSRTFLNATKFEVVDEKLELEGAVIQNTMNSQNGRTRNSLIQEIDISKSLPDKYRSVDELVTDLVEDYR